MTLKEAALKYATELNWPVFPLVPRGKRPRISRADGGHGYLDATTDRKQIEAWWTDYPDANLGLPTGKRTNLTVLDVDTKSWDGKHGDRTLAALETIHGVLPATVTLQTWSGGRQFWFQYRPEITNAAGAFGEWLDARSQGGYVLLPPSQVTEAGHAGQYLWKGEPTSPRAALPSWLVDVHQQVTRQAMASTLQQPAYNAQDYTPQPIPKGWRDDALYRIGRRLRQTGITERAFGEALRVTNQDLCQPPLTEDEMKRLITHAWNQEDRK